MSFDQQLEYGRIETSDRVPPQRSRAAWKQKKPTWSNTLKHSTTSAYWSTSLPCRRGLLVS